jgi:hypothetical protein
LGEHFSRIFKLFNAAAATISAGQENTTFYSGMVFLLGVVVAILGKNRSARVFMFYYKSSKS